MALDALRIIRSRIEGMFTRFAEVGQRLRVDMNRFLVAARVDWQETARTNRLRFPDGVSALDLAETDVSGRGQPYQIVVQATPISDTPSGYNTIDIDPDEFGNLEDFLDNYGLSLGDLREVRFDKG